MIYLNLSLSCQSKRSIENDVKNNSSKTFYKKDILKQLTTAECFGDFWGDIFSMKITTRKDEEKGMKRQETDEMQAFVVDVKSVSKGPGEVFKNYLRQVMLFNSTPKVTLEG